MTVPTPQGLGAIAQFDLDLATPAPFVYLTWLNPPFSTLNYVRIFRDGSLIDRVATLDHHHQLFQHYVDTSVSPGSTYTYSIQFEEYTAGATPSSVYGAGSKGTIVLVPLFPDAFTPPPAQDTDGVKRWTFTDVYERGPTPYTYTFQVNPNDGGSPTFEKSVVTQRVTGPNEMPIIQEGAPGEAQISFSGVILTQAQLETMEIWFRKRILMLVQDDLGRRFYGVFSHWTPQRSRRSSNPWFHSYTAGMTVVAYYNASGQRVFGRFL